MGGVAVDEPHPAGVMHVDGPARAEHVGCSRNLAPCLRRHPSRTCGLRKTTIVYGSCRRVGFLTILQHARMCAAEVFTLVARQPLYAVVLKMCFKAGHGT